MKKLPLIAPPALRAEPQLADLRTLQRGNRLSITPVDEAHWVLIEKMVRNLET